MLIVSDAELSVITLQCKYHLRCVCTRECVRACVYICVKSAILESTVSENIVRCFVVEIPHASTRPSLLGRGLCLGKGVF